MIGQLVVERIVVDKNDREIAGGGQRRIEEDQMFTRDKPGRHAHVGPGSSADEEKSVLGKRKGFTAENARKAVAAALRPFRVVVARNDKKGFIKPVEDIFRQRQLRIRTEFADIARQDDKTDPGLLIDIRYRERQILRAFSAADMGVGDEGELEGLGRTSWREEEDY